MATTTYPPKSVSHFAFPRTGKRGVPQQFPRRLFEMLNSETCLIEQSDKHPKVISWNALGNAFRIFDVAEFASTVLPKYFRTKKFSSFQRNLNLYGFAKVRRGVDGDAYAHPSFTRDHPENLLNLRKISTAVARRRMVSDVDTVTALMRSVSPTEVISHAKIIYQECNVPVKHQISPKPSKVTTADPATSHDRGKLDLLALALEHEFEGGF